jgi:hypothetical protein
VKTGPAPLEADYAKAYDQAYAKQYMETFQQTLDVNSAVARAREVGAVAGRAAVTEAVKNGKLISAPARSSPTS